MKSAVAIQADRGLESDLGQPQGIAGAHQRKLRVGQVQLDAGEVKARALTRIHEATNLFHVVLLVLHRLLADHHQLLGGKHAEVGDPHVQRGRLFGGSRIGLAGPFHSVGLRDEGRRLAKVVDELAGRDAEKVVVQRVAGPEIVLCLIVLGQGGVHHHGRQQEVGRGSLILGLRIHPGQIGRARLAATGVRLPGLGQGCLHLGLFAVGDLQGLVEREYLALGPGGNCRDHTGQSHGHSEPASTYQRDDSSDEHGYSSPAFAATATAGDSDGLALPCSVGWRLRTRPRSPSNTS